MAIGVCSRCGKCWETSEEDACTPGTLCPECFRQQRGQDLEAQDLEAQDLEAQDPPEETTSPAEVEAGEGFLDLDDLANQIKEDEADSANTGQTRSRYYLDPETGNWGAW